MLDISRNKKVNLFLGCFFAGNVLVLLTVITKNSQTSSNGVPYHNNGGKKVHYDTTSRKLLDNNNDKVHRSRASVYRADDVTHKMVDVPVDQNAQNNDVIQLAHKPVPEPQDQAPQKHVPPALIGEDRNPESTFQVPNIVHYIWYNHQHAPLQFHHMLSIKAASKFIKPDVIYFHTDNEPNGTYWEMVKNDVPNFKIMKREPPWEVFGEKVKEPFYYTSHSNVDRVKVLMEYGGIYFDFDFVALQSFDDLRKQVCVIGWESEHQACGSVILASKDSFFLTLWINAYLDDYRIEEWAYNTGKVPFHLAKRFPHLCYSEKTKLNRPNFKEIYLIYEENNKQWDWRQNYGVHLWYRLWKDSDSFKGVEPDEHTVKTLNNRFGEIARTILYDTADIIT